MKIRWKAVCDECGGELTMTPERYTIDIANIGTPCGMCDRYTPALFRRPVFIITGTEAV